MHFKGSNKSDLSLIQIYLDASDLYVQTGLTKII